MNNKDLLTVAKGMGLDAHIYKDLHEDGDFVKLVVIKTKYSIYNFNPTEGELMKWLLTKGEFILVASDYALFNPIKGSLIYSDKGSLIENLLNIVLEVVNDE